MAFAGNPLLYRNVVFFRADPSLAGVLLDRRYQPANCRTFFKLALAACSWRIKALLCQSARVPEGEDPPFRREESQCSLGGGYRSPS